MGLDICVYQKLTQVMNPELDEDGYPIDPNVWHPGSSMEWSEANWPGRGMPLIPTACYAYEGSDSFRAGSYFGYTERFRLPLFDLIGAERPSDGSWYVPQGPFHELLDFADNEGVIGHYVSAKLAKDFADWQERAEAYAESLGECGEYFLQTYNNFREAFELAADNGAVEFC